MHSRRTFIKAKSATTLALVVGIPLFDRKASLLHAAADNQALSPSIWVKVFPDNQVEICVSKAEMGQGVYSNLPMILADEMDADWDQVTIRMVADTNEFAAFGGTFGSTSVRGSFEVLRRAGAAMRELFLEAAAKKFDLPTKTLKTNAGQVMLPDGNRIPYGDLLEEAKKQLPLNENPRLKTPNEYQLIGRSVDRKDVPDKIEGRTVFGLDAELPDMLYAAIKQNPVFGSKILNFSELEGQNHGAIALCEVPGGVIAVAPSYWEAEQCLRKLTIQYSQPDGAGELNNQFIRDQLSVQLNETGAIAEQKGDVSQTPEDELFSAEYQAPYLAHITMEPMCCLASVEGDTCKVIAPVQFGSAAAQSVATALGIEMGQVEVTRTFLGGGYGRKIGFDYPAQAALASKKVGKPVKLIWSREQDNSHDFYRPAFAARIKGRVKNGRIDTWIAKSTGASPLASGPQEKPDPLSIDGFAGLLYNLPNLDIRYQHWDPGIPVGFWRSVGLSQNAYFVESFIDELAAANGLDPFEIRLNMLENNSRATRLLNRLREESNWDQSNAQKGMALAFSHGSLIGAVVELTPLGRKWKVKKIDAVVDCGVAVNPRNIETQIQGGMLYGLTAALYGDLPVSGGKVSFDNFYQATNLRLKDVPEMKVHIIAEGDTMGGIVEPGTAIIAPATTNSLFRATGTPIRQLPISSSGLI